jgi:hypothetical protein
MWTRAHYAWQNSPHPALTAARAHWDRVLPRTFESSVSYPEGDSVTVGYAGLAGGRAPVLHTLEELRERLGTGTSGRRATPVGRRHLLRGERLPEADIVAIGCTATEAARLPRASALVLPYRVHLVVDTTCDPDTLRGQISRRERWQFSRSLRTRDLGFERATDEASFRYFYERMHRPTVIRRHGERARTEDPDVAYECLFRHGVLFFVTEQGERVAGGLCRWERRTRTMITRLLGVLDGEPEYYDNGAFKLWYHLLLDWACTVEVDRVDFHYTEPFIGRGIFQWKQRFHPAVELPRNNYARRRLWLHATRDTPRIRDFLHTNPVLASTGDEGLHAVYFHDRDRPPRTDLVGDCPGVLGRRLVDLDDFLAPVRAQGGEHDEHPSLVR